MLDVHDGRIHMVRGVLNNDKLGHLGLIGDARGISIETDKASELDPPSAPADD
ncbi:hypothetical protein GCM10023205_79380 [Yinghuangia aomiensis]|uniref:Uncharacterized protein n=1 Tax=Yinghuangia aomiensis TaxID=676205 RepID=A0ABP9IDK3_9ACTN